MALQTAFYIIGIIFMGLMILIVAALAVGIFMIRSKVNHIHASIERKVGPIKRVIEKGSDIARETAKKATASLRHR